MGPVGEDERWNAFEPFHDYLIQAFPLTYVINSFCVYNKNMMLFISHKNLTLTKVNTYGLLYEWKGSDDSLKPLLLTGHQGLSREYRRLRPLTNTTSTICGIIWPADVIPVDPETVDKWVHPPYSGYYDGIVQD